MSTYIDNICVVKKHILSNGLVPNSRYVKRHYAKQNRASNTTTWFSCASVIRRIQKNLVSASNFTNDPSVAEIYPLASVVIIAWITCSAYLSLIYCHCTNQVGNNTYTHCHSYDFSVRQNQIAKYCSKKRAKNCNDSRINSLHSTCFFLEQRINDNS